MSLQIYADADALATGAAELIIQHAAEAIASRGVFNLALSGGSTPLAVYRKLAQPANSSRINWPHVHLFWSDERCVPPDHADSNYGAAKAALLDAVAIPAANVHRMRGELPPEEAAQEYRDELTAHFHSRGFPIFDLILLGLGPDGHTASLFSRSQGMIHGEVPVVENYIAHLESWRLTFTFSLINAARSVAFLVSGSGKAEVVREVLEGDRPLPAKSVNPHSGELLWLLDADAAKLLDN
jgi:6-phosphogluconolactonase